MSIDIRFIPNTKCTMMAIIRNHTARVLDTVNAVFRKNFTHSYVVKIIEAECVVFAVQEITGPVIKLLYFFIKLIFPAQVKIISFIAA